MGAADPSRSGLVASGERWAGGGRPQSGAASVPAWNLGIGGAARPGEEELHHMHAVNTLGAASPGATVEPAAGEPRAATPGPLSKRFRYGWVLEALVIATVGFLYETARNLVTGSAAQSLRNAKTLTGIERALGIYQERAFQHFFLDMPALVALWNFYYDTAHFLVPLFVGIYLYIQAPARYVRMRNTFFFLLLGFGLLSWYLLPITAPKWMPASYGFHDTQVEYYNVGPQTPLAYGADGEPTKAVIAATGNPYGGLPSHHVSWSLFCALALWPVVRRRWVKGLLVAHVLLTIGAITVTGNHRFIDIAGSVIEVTVAYSLAVLLERALARRRARRLGAAPVLAPA